ncbi:hypothetical protein ACHWQZ_G016829 [Mnemiopsis leidyi]
MDHSGMDHSGMDSEDSGNMGGMNDGDTGGMDHSGMTASHGTTFFASRYATILFEGASTTSVGGLVGAVIIVLLVSVMYEILRRYKAYFDNPLGRCWCTCGDQNSSSVIQMRGVEREQSPPTVSADENPPKNDHTVIVPGASENKHGKTAKKIKNMCLRHRTFYIAVSISLHVISLTLSYFLMLVAMTFNVWLFLAVILGSGLGKLIDMTLFEDVIGDSSQSHCNMP